MDSREIILAAVERKIRTEKDLRELKILAAGNSGKLVKNSELVAAYADLVGSGEIVADPILEKLFRKARGRTLSGVSPVAVLTRPSGCPGRCVFCPTEKGMPKSYLSNEPAVMRAMRVEFDPFRQVRSRLDALAACGHPTSKIELIVMGGTWSAHPSRYQTFFIRRCLQALNESKTFDSLDVAKKKNEKAAHRLVGMTLETRPDCITKLEVQKMLRLGCTRVELGAQSTSDEILKKMKRGHGVAATKNAVKLLKNAGLKVGLHFMPNLPNATPESDLEMFREIFSSPDLAVDQMKIYPCVLVAGAELEKWWKQKKWIPYSNETLTNLLAEIKKLTPPWLRLSRVIRDIPATSILAGSKLTNLRQILQQKKVKCRCVRCREIREEKFDATKAKLVTREHEASGGREIFLSFEVGDERLLSLLRLRIEPNSDVAFVRELHSYGEQIAVGTAKKSGQNRGFGSRLLKESEKIAKQNGAKKIKIISGIGVRDFYRKNGYHLDREKIYVEKNLK